MAYRDHKYNVGTEISSGLDTFTKTLAAVKAAKEFKADQAISKAQEEAWAKAEAAAAASGGTTFNQEGYREAQGFTKDGASQADILRRQDEEMGGVDAAKMTQAGLASAPGWMGTDADRAAGAKSAADTLAAVNAIDASPEAARRALDLKGRGARNAQNYAASQAANQGFDTVTAVSPRVPSSIGLGTEMPSVQTQPGLPGAETAELAPLPKVPTTLDDPTNLVGSRAGTQVPAGTQANPGLVDAVVNAPAPAAGQSAPAPAAKPKATLEGAAIERQKMTANEFYHRDYVPHIVGTMMKAGRIKDAAAFEEWSRSSKGQNIGSTWTQGRMALERGDVKGAMESVVRLYNQQVPDKQYATAKMHEDGKKYTLEIREEGTNKLIHSKEGDGTELGRLAYGMMTPESTFKYMQGLDAEAAKNAREDAKMEKEHANAVALKTLETDEVTPVTVRLDQAMVDRLPEAQREAAKAYLSKDVIMLRKKKNGDLVSVLGEKATDSAGDAVRAVLAASTLSTAEMNRQRLGLDIADKQKEADAERNTLELVKSGRVARNRDGLTIDGKQATSAEAARLAPFAHLIKAAAVPSPLLGNIGR